MALSFIVDCTKSFGSALLVSSPIVLASTIVDLAVQFGPWDYFALMLLTFVTVAAIFDVSVLRSLTSLALGLFLHLIGIDKLTGQARLAFDGPALIHGISTTMLAVGHFAMGEALYVASRFNNITERLEPVRGSV